MAQYQARGWVAWHHHMALVALAVLFQMQERLSGSALLPDLTAADIMEPMEWALIRRPSETELVARIARRHEKRKRSAAHKRAVQQKQRAFPKKLEDAKQQSRSKLAASKPSRCAQRHKPLRFHRFGRWTCH